METIMWLSSNEDYMSSDEEIVIDKKENEHEINNILDGNEIFLEPRVGMMFNSEEEVRAYYT